MSFLDFLAEKKIITKDQIPFIEREVLDEDRGLEKSLVKLGITVPEILTLRGEYLNIPIKEFEAQDIPFEILRYIPEKTADHYKVAPLGISDGVLEVGIVDPDNIEARDAIQFVSSKINMPYKLFLISEGAFQKILKA